MNIVNQRVANFIKVFSMFMVFACLMYMYAYTSGKDNLGSAYGWFFELSTKQIFFFGLAVFAVFNMVMNMGINSYKHSHAREGSSLLYKNDELKERMLMWFTYVAASVNVLIASIIAFLALVKLNEEADISGLFLLPTAGMLFFAIACGGVFWTLFRGAKA